MEERRHITVETPTSCKRTLVLIGDNNEECYLDMNVIENMYNVLTSGGNIELIGFDEMTYELKSKDFKRIRLDLTSTWIVNDTIEKIVKNDYNRCDYKMMKEKQSNVTKLKSLGIGMLCELVYCLKSFPSCPGCQNDWPCCTGSCDYSKTFLSKIEYTGDELYSDDEEDESELETDENEYDDEDDDDSSEDSLDYEMMGKSEEDEDEGSSDEDYNEEETRPKAQFNVSRVVHNVF